MNMTMTMRPDSDCQNSAGEYLRDLIGAPPDDLLWDDVHHLQGHARCSGREIIVIAARDSAHEPLVVTVEDWDTIRHSFGRDRGELLRNSAILSHSRFLEVLAAA
ncbi:MAG: hypothetical protein JWN99_1822 [Ilumatobacteraceae bacterium]|nr:hypothetical protein [Ilumatobacteraceae bacterium]